MTKEKDKGNVMIPVYIGVEDPDPGYLYPRVSPCFDSGVIGYVKLTDNLNGQSFVCGEVSPHIGITRLKSTGEYVLTYGSTPYTINDMLPYGVTVSPSLALKEILLSHDAQLLDEFPDLRDLA